MVPLSKLQLVFLRIGNLTFGGGDPTMAALERELVTRRRWLSPEKYGLCYGLARITPGTNLLAFCAAAAWFLRGWTGAVLAVLAVTVPSAVLVVWLTHIYEILKDNTLAMGAIAGSLAAAVGMMTAAAWSLIRPYVGRKTWFRTLVLAGGSIVLLLQFSVPPIQVLALAAVTGFFWREPAGEDSRPGEPS